MGVLEPLEEAIDEHVPATPPDLQDLQNHQDPGDNSEDDLFADTATKDHATVFTYNNLSFKHIIPVLPAKGEFDDILDVYTQNNTLGKQTPPQKKKKNFCSKCFEEVKRDLKKLAKVIENYKNERDAARAENENLKKEVEELKKRLKQKEETDKIKVNVSIDNKESVDVSVKHKNSQNARNFFNDGAVKQMCGINCFSVNLRKHAERPVQTLRNEDIYAEFQPKSKKTVAELRKEFFEQDFKSEQKSFTSYNYLEIKPEEEKTNSVKSRMTIKILPKKKITDIISKLTSKFGRSKVIPEMPPITMFQRFEKTREVWSTDLQVNCA